MSNAPADPTGVGSMVLPDTWKVVDLLRADVLARSAQWKP